MIELLHIDCMEYMKDCKDNQFDLAIVDPPYGIGKRIMGTWGKKTGMNEAVKWDKPPTKQYWHELFRISKNHIVCGANYFIEYLYSSRGVICWDKMNGTNSLSDFEFVWTSFNHKTARIFRLHHFSHGYGKKIHPTQKPVTFYRWTLQNYAKQGDTILDTHGGSFSSAIACDIEGFDLTLCEIDKDYYDDGVKRFNIHKAQKTLF